MCDCIGSVGTASCCSLADTLAVGNDAGGADILMSGGRIFVNGIKPQGTNPLLIGFNSTPGASSQYVSILATSNPMATGASIGLNPGNVIGPDPVGGSVDISAGSVQPGNPTGTAGGVVISAGAPSTDGANPGGNIECLLGSRFGDYASAGFFRVRTFDLTLLELGEGARLDTASPGDALILNASKQAVWAPPAPSRHISLTARASLSAATVVGANTPMFIYAGNLQTTTPTVDGFIHALQAQALYNSFAQIVAPTQISFEILKNGAAWIALPNVVPGTPEVWSLGTKYTFVAGDVLAPIVIVRNAALTGTLIAQMQISLEF